MVIMTLRSRARRSPDRGFQPIRLRHSVNECGMRQQHTATKSVYGTQRDRDLFMNSRDLSHTCINAIILDRLGKNDEKKSEFHLQYTYYISIKSSRRALSIAVPCVFSRAHSASISPDHFSAASSENVCTSL